MAKTEAQKRARDNWNRANTSIIAVNVKNEQKEKFKEACERRGTTMNAVLLSSVRSFLGEDQSSPSPLPLPAGWAPGKPSVLRTFHAAGGWQLDIEEQGTHYGAWLSNIGSDQKQYLVGADKSKHTLDEFISLVLDNIAEYQHDYANEFLGE